MMLSLDEYNLDLIQEVRLNASDEENPLSLPESFTQYIADLLTESGEFSNPSIASYNVLKMAVSGIDWDDERNYLTVFVSDFSPVSDVQSLTKTALVPLLKKCMEFTKQSSQDLHTKVDPSLAVYDVITEIKSVWQQVKLIKFIILTNKILKTSIPESGKLLGIDYQCEAWDIERIFKVTTSGITHEPINLLFSDFMDLGIPFLGPFGPGVEYQSYMVVFPGFILAQIYSAYGPRLLELNVRSFLQTRGKINAGIQATLTNEPSKFLAYNNGLSLTASDVETNRGHITALRDVQIVNGGQTTASLYHALSKGKVELSEVEVQAKITVMSGESRDVLAPQISLYSNSQNPVRMADFSANDPFHVELEKISRSVWAPSGDGSNVLSRWFFERARGQYADSVARELTPSAQKKFKLEHPISQKILKTDVAKYEHAWDQLPHLVSRGAEKNFKEFLQRRKEVGRTKLPTQEDFRRIVAKTILWKRTESIVTKLRLGGYRAPTVAYTIALVSNRTVQRIDLEAIWHRQELPQELADAVTELAPLVFDRLMESAGTANVTEWAKKDKCWDEIQKIEWSAPEAILGGAELLAGVRKDETAPARVQPQNDAESKALEEVQDVSSETWFRIASWAKETSNLEAWQRGLAVSLGQRGKRNQKPTVKQALQGVKILAEAKRVGFDLSTELRA